MNRTITTLGGKKIELNPVDVGTMERLEGAMKVSSKSFQELSKKIAKMTDSDVDIEVLRTMCTTVRVFTDTLFGEGTANRLFADNNDVEELVSFYSDVLTAFDEEGDRVTGVLTKMWHVGGKNDSE
ncbi:hypothetical protein GCWU000322_00086 [Eubacterium saphenum ATCC 49989]|nr:hypothetical protein GCWU000322_00086 [Eubacterium saphenum ATCC 49989]